MSSPLNKRKRRHTIVTQRKKSVNFCSTPLLDRFDRLSSISISAVDTNSSSSRKGQSNRQILGGISERKKVKKGKLQKKKLQRKSGQGENDSEEEEEGPKKKKKKKKKSFAQKDSDVDWETCDEALRQSPSRRTITSGSDVLFKDLRSPEKIREAPHSFGEHRLDSPILRPREWQVDSPKRIDFDGKEGTLPLVGLPPFVRMERFDSDDEEKDDVFLRRENTIKTYLGLKTEKQNKNDARYMKCKQWLVDVSVPTASSDLLWNNFVTDNYEKISKYLAPPSNDKQKSLRKKKDPKGNNDGDNDAKDRGSQNDFKGIGFEEVKSKLRTEMDVVRGHWDTSLKKWVRVHDTYRFPETENLEGQNEANEKIEKMRLNQYLEKCRLQKENIIELGSNSSSSSSFTHLQNVEKSYENLVRRPDKKNKRRKRLRENPKFESKRFKMAIEDVSDSELQRINRIREFASRLNANEKRMVGEVSLPSTSKDVKNNYNTVSSLKRMKDKEGHKKEDCKRQKLAKAKMKPSIKSIQTLTTVQFKKDNKNWRIT